MQTGFYIVIEGIVGTGKSTQSKKLFTYLKAKYPKKEVVLTFEPGGSEIANAIRKVVQGTKFTEEMDPVAEAYLYASSRAQTLRRVVQPILKKGGIVISDRSYISSLAIQGHARKLGLDQIIKINDIALDGIMPNLVIFLDIHHETGLKRANDHDGDRLEAESLAFYRRIRSGYQKAAQLPRNKKIWHTLDTSDLGIDEVFEQVCATVDHALKK